MFGTQDKALYTTLPPEPEILDKRVRTCLARHSLHASIRAATRHRFEPFELRFALKLKILVVTKKSGVMAWYRRMTWCDYPRNIVLVLRVGNFVLRF